VTTSRTHASGEVGRRGPAWTCLRLVAGGGALASFGQLLGESYQQAGTVIWMVGAVFFALAALLALVDWRGLQAEIARLPTKTRYGFLMTRRAAVRMGAFLLLAGRLTPSAWAASTRESARRGTCCCALAGETGAACCARRRAASRR
jgi:hypothetical protein